MSSVPTVTGNFPAVPEDLQANAPVGLRVLLDERLLARFEKFADLMSKASGVIPAHLLGKKEACFAVIVKSLTWGLDPYYVAAGTYQPRPGAKIGYEGKLIKAILEASGHFDGPITLEYFGDWSRVQGKWTKERSQKDSSDGEPRWYAKPAWKDEDEAGLGVIVRGRLKKEAEARTFSFEMRQAFPRNSTSWANDPKTQLGYTAIRRFGDNAVPHVLAGVPFPDDPEQENLGPDNAKDVTPQGHDPLFQALDVEDQSDRPAGPDESSGGRSDPQKSEAGGRPAWVCATGEVSEFSASIKGFQGWFEAARHEMQALADDNEESARVWSLNRETAQRILSKIPENESTALLRGNIQALIAFSDSAEEAILSESAMNAG